MGFGKTFVQTDGKYDLIVKLEKDLKKAFKKIKNMQKFNQKVKDQTFIS